MDDRIKTLEGDFNARGLRFGIVASRFNDFIVDRLLDAAVGTLLKHGVAAGDIEVVRVPGAFETPLADQEDGDEPPLQRADRARLRDPRRDAALRLRRGRSEPRHRRRSSSSEEIPIGFGILTVDTIEQAIERAGTKAGNKGADAALAAIQMATVLRQLEQ